MNDLQTAQIDSLIEEVIVNFEFRISSKIVRQEHYRDRNVHQLVDLRKTTESTPQKKNIRTLQNLRYDWCPTWERRGRARWPWIASLSGVSPGNVSFWAWTAPDQHWAMTSLVRFESISRVPFDCRPPVDRRRSVVAGDHLVCLIFCGSLDRDYPPTSLTVNLTLGLFREGDNTPLRVRGSIVCSAANRRLVWSCTNVTVCEIGYCG